MSWQHPMCSISAVRPIVQRHPCTLHFQSFDQDHLERAELQHGSNNRACQVAHACGSSLLRSGPSRNCAYSRPARNRFERCWSLVLSYQTFRRVAIDEEIVSYLASAEPPYRADRGDRTTVLLVRYIACWIPIAYRVSASDTIDCPNMA